MAFEDAVEGDEYKIIDKDYADIIGDKIFFVRKMHYSDDMAVFAIPNGTPFALGSEQVEPVVVDPNKFKRVV